MAVKVGINGFGRIGRCVLRSALEHKLDIDFVSINDLTDPKTLAHLLKYDSVHGNLKNEITYGEDYIAIDGKKIQITKEKDPANLPWAKLGVEVVLESTGLFTKRPDAEKHLQAGAKKVIISAPSKSDIKTIVYNVNHNILSGDEEVISAASCTTNCLAPVLDIIEKNIGIERGFMTTVHAYTNDQATLDIPHNKGILARRGRACAQNIVPASTGAASAIGKVIPSLMGKMDGNAFRVPVSDGSVIDVTLVLKRSTTKEEINTLFQNNQNETLKFTMEPIVSSDVIGRKVGALVDGLSTTILKDGGNELVKIVAWYDNEMGYTSQMMRTAKHIANLK